MAIGLLSGRGQPGGPVDETYQRVQVLVEQFEKKFGATNCLVLTGCHLGTEEGQAVFIKRHQIENCLDYVEEVTRLVLESTPF
jgi:hypothetical protein